MKIYIYGTGSGAKRFVETIESIGEKIDIIAFIDGDNTKHGKIYYNRPIIDITSINDNCLYDYIFIAAEFKEIYFKILSHDIPQEKVIVVYPKVLEEIYEEEREKFDRLSVHLLSGLLDFSYSKSVGIYFIKNEKGTSLEDRDIKVNVLEYLHLKNSLETNDFHEKMLRLMKTNFDYAVITGEAIDIYYLLLNEGVPREKIIILSEETIELLYDNEIKKRNEIKFIYGTQAYPVVLYNEQEKFNKIVFDRCNRPVVSIVIPVEDTWEYTYNCLVSIKENTDEVNYEVILLVNPFATYIQTIKNYIYNIKIVEDNLKEQRGYNLNINSILQEAKGTYIHILHNKTNVQKGWLSTLLKTINKNEDIGLIGSKIVLSSEKVKSAGGIVFNDGSIESYGSNFNLTAPEVNYLKEVDWISPESMLVKKEVLEGVKESSLSFLTSTYYAINLAFEIRKMGYKIVYQPMSTVVSFNIKEEQNSCRIDSKTFVDRHKQARCNQTEFGKHQLKARERSKKTIIIIENYCCRFDQDAGSRTIFQYIELFIDMGLSVKYLPDDFTPTQPYTSILQQMGVEVLYGSYYAMRWKRWIKDNSQDIDYVFINRPNNACKYAEYIRKNTEAKIIYNVVDLHFLREEREFQVTKNIKLLESSNKNKIIEEKIINSADIVTTLSYDEKDIMEKQFNPKKVMILPIFCYKEFINHDYTQIPNRKDLLFVGGFGHRPNEDAVLWFLDTIWPKVRAKIHGIKFYIVGSNPTNMILQRKSEDIIVTGYVSDDELQKLYSRCKICVIPLRYGAGIKGKTIEAMYNGIQIVSTQIGLEGLPEVEKIIPPIDDSEEFGDKIIDLYYDDEGIRKNIQNYEVYIIDRFSYKHARDVMDKLIK